MADELMDKFRQMQDKNAQGTNPPNKNDAFTVGDNPVGNAPAGQNSLGIGTTGTDAQNNPGSTPQTSNTAAGTDAPKDPGGTQPSELKDAQPKDKNTAAGMNLADASRVEEGDPQSLLDKCTDILKEYNNRESEIPITSDYWAMMNKYRVMINAPKKRKSDQ